MNPEKSTQITGKVERQDVFLGFMNWLHRARKSWKLRLFYRTTDLDDIKIWDLGEDGAFFQSYRSQYEFSYESKEQVPVSRKNEIVFFPKGSEPLDRPTEMNFTNLRKSYPIEGSEEVINCKNCKGTGSTWGLLDKRPKTCKKCKGEGALFQYMAKSYRWEAKTNQSPILNPNSKSKSTGKMVRELIKKGGGLKIEAIQESEVLRVSNLLNPRIRDLIPLAQQANKDYKQTLSQGGFELLFREETLYYVPVSYINLEVGNSFGQFFLAGDRKKSKNRRPPIKLSFWKLFAWTSLLLYPAIGLSMMFGIISGVPDMTWLAPAATLLPVATTSILDWRRKKKRHRWMIVDNAEFDGWHLSYLLAWSLSHHGKGRITDPGFTHLLEAPDEMETASRNSYLFHLEVNPDTEPKPEVIELLNLHHESLKLYPGESSPILSGSDNWWVMVGESFSEQEEKRVIDLLNWRIKKVKKVPFITVVVSQAAPLKNNYFDAITNPEARARLKIIHLPLKKLTEDIKMGRFSEVYPHLAELFPKEQKQLISGIDKPVNKKMIPPTDG